tara:strand:+ start:253 stop:453 length:201 start_codon:yes stop_codon:yes gene_type:complete
MGRKRSAPPPPPEKKAAEIRQEKEDAKLDKQIESREAARKRAKQGRRSLISGSERGIYDDKNKTLG